MYNHRYSFLILLQLASDVSLTRTVFATAPSVLGAKFAPTGALIHVAFNRPIAVSSLTTCAHIFSTGLALLGTSPSCTWSDSQHLVIAPSDDATIVPSDSLTFKANSVKRDEMFGKALSGSVTVSGPDHAVEPVPFIMGKFYLRVNSDLLWNRLKKCLNFVAHVSQIALQFIVRHWRDVSNSRWSKDIVVDNISGRPSPPLSPHIN